MCVCVCVCVCISYNQILDFNIVSFITLKIHIFYFISCIQIIDIYVISTVYDLHFFDEILIYFITCIQMPDIYSISYIALKIYFVNFISCI